MTTKASTDRVKHDSSPRDRLLRAAELYYSEGINSVGINRILHEAQTPIMSLYRHFGSKDGLVGEFFLDKGGRVRHFFEREAEARADSGRGRILALFDILAEVFADDDFRGCAFINASLETKEAEHPLRAIALDHKEWTRGLFRRYAAEMGAADPTLLANWLTMVMDGAFVTAEMRRGDPTVGANARAMVELLLDTAPCSQPV